MTPVELQKLREDLAEHDPSVDVQGYEPEGDNDPQVFVESRKLTADKIIGLLDATGWLGVRPSGGELVEIIRHDLDMPGTESTFILFDDTQSHRPL